MRIIGGTHRGRKLFSPEGRKTRPTSDRVREALFDILGPAVAGSAFLDVFAGTGAVGLEAASRGASRVILVESDRDSLAALRRNVEAMKPAGVEVMARDAAAALRFLAAKNDPFDFVFLDPPYADADTALELAERYAPEGLLSERGVVVLEHRYKNQPQAKNRLCKFDERHYGDTGLSFYHLTTSNDGKDV